MTIVIPTDRPKSVRNRCVIEVFGGVFVFSRCFLDFSVGVGAFVIGRSQISSFFMYSRYQCIHCYKYEDGEGQRILSCKCTVLCYILEYIYILTDIKNAYYLKIVR